MVWAILSALGIFSREILQMPQGTNKWPQRLYPPTWWFPLLYEAALARNLFLNGLFKWAAGASRGQAGQLL